MQAAAAETQGRGKTRLESGKAQTDELFLSDASRSSRLARRLAAVLLLRLPPYEPEVSEESVFIILPTNDRQRELVLQTLGGQASPQSPVPPDFPPPPPTRRLAALKIKTRKLPLRPRGSTKECGKKRRRTRWLCTSEESVSDSHDSADASVEASKLKDSTFRQNLQKVSTFARTGRPTRAPAAPIGALLPGRHLRTLSAFFSLFNI